MRALVCAVAVVAASACGQSAGDYTIKTVFDPCEPVVLAPEAATTDAERQGVVDGASMWNALAGARYVVDGVDADVADAPHIPVHFDPAGSNFHGFYDDSRGEIFVNDSLVNRDRLAITMAHEIGHTLGLVHVPVDARASLMNPGNLTVRPTAQDRAAFVDLWGDCPKNDAAGAQP